MENGQADAGRDGRIRLARSKSRVQTGARKYLVLTFPVQLITSRRIGNLTRLIPTLLLYVMTIHTAYIYTISRLTRDGTAEPVSRDQIFRRERGQGNVYFPCSADHEQDWQPYPVDLYSTVCGDHTNIPRVGWRYASMTTQQRWWPQWQHIDAASRESRISEPVGARSKVARRGRCGRGPDNISVAFATCIVQQSRPQYIRSTY